MLLGGMYTAQSIVSVTAGNMRWYLNPTEVAQVVQLLQDSTSMCAIARRFVSPAQSQ